MNPLIQCSACEGCGQVEVTGVYAETYLLLAKQKKPINGADFARKVNVNPTAMNNRLVWLEQNGLATSKRNGRERLWQAATL